MVDYVQHFSLFVFNSQNDLLTLSVLLYGISSLGLKKFFFFSFSFSFIYLIYHLSSFVPFILISMGTVRSETMLVCNRNDGPEFRGAIFKLRNEIVPNRCKLQSLLAVSVTVPQIQKLKTSSSGGQIYWRTV